MFAPPPPPKEGKEGKVSRAEMERLAQARQQQFVRTQQRMEELFAESARRDWRPLFSLTANMHRLGEALLGSDAAYVDMARALTGPQQIAGVPPANDRRFADTQTPQYPWIWSAGVLAAICAASVWTLSFRVKTLDRLK
jgi:hypothetical protein